MTGEITWAELTSQPDAWKALLSRLESGTLKLPVDPAEYDEVLLLGSGTSYYLGLALADWMRRRGISARAIPSCEAILDSWETRQSDLKRLAIGLSRSGKSSELILAEAKLRSAGYDTLGVSCTAGSDLVTRAQHAVVVEEGFEDGLVMLRSFTSMLIALQWLTGSAEDRAALAELPAHGRKILDDYAEPLKAAAAARPFDRFVMLASGADYALACEGALKIQEMAIATSEAYHSLDYRHGPKACADEGTMLVLFALSDRAHGLSLASDVRDLGAAVTVVGPDAAAYSEIADLTVPAGKVDMDQGVAAALSLLPVQVFAYATALRRDKNPDAPVNLSKVVLF